MFFTNHALWENSCAEELAQQVIEPEAQLSGTFIFELIARRLIRALGDNEGRIWNQ